MTKSRRPRGACVVLNALSKCTVWLACMLHARCREGFDRGAVPWPSWGSLTPHATDRVWDPCRLQMAAVVELHQLKDSNLESSASIAGDVSSVGSLVLRVLQAVSSLVNPPKPKSANNVSCLTGQGLACAACLSVRMLMLGKNITTTAEQQCPRLAAHPTWTCCYKVVPAAHLF